MMKPTMPCVLCLLFLGAALFLAPPARAGDPPLTPREKALLQRLGELEQRVQELEQRLGAPPASPEPEKTPPPPREAKEAEGVQAPVQEQPEGAEAEEAAKQAAAKPEEPEKAKSGLDLRAYWKDGLRFESEDKRFQLRVGGRLHLDYAFFEQETDLREAFGDDQNGMAFRRARINFQGQIYDHVEYRAEYDFAGNTGEGKFKDAYIGLKDIPVVGHIRVGHMREPFGLERCTGVSYHTFMELALPNVFAPNRNLGLMLYNSHLDDRIRWAAGVFQETDDFPSVDDADEERGPAVTARITGLPWYARDGRRLLHLGFAYSHRDPDGDGPAGAVRGWRSRPESNQANYYLDTDANGLGYLSLSNAQLDNIDLWGTEAALVFGPFSMQGEYMVARADTDLAGNVLLSGGYAQASYFLTGEHRPYERTEAAWGRVKPKRNFSFGKNKERGWGAWELALRYSFLDLSDGIIRGGVEHNATAGVNWYLNPNMRVMLNYVYAHIDHSLADGDLNIIQGRVQIDF